MRSSVLHVPASLAPRERLLRFTAHIAGGGATFVAHGHVLTISLRGLGRRFRLTFTERIRVAKRAEGFSFTRAYHRC